MPNSKICFVISPIGPPDSEARKRADTLLEYIISPAVKECGYEPLRADQISESGLITHQIIQHLIDAPLVVADLTGNNANVFYELAIRHAIRKPVVHLIETGETPPFDTKDTRTINVAINNLKTAEEAKKQITCHIRSFEKSTIPITTPISIAIDIKQITESTSDKDKGIAIVLGKLDEMNSRLSVIENTIYKGKYQQWRPDEESLSFVLKARNEAEQQFTREAFMADLKKRSELAHKKNILNAMKESEGNPH